MPGSRLRTARLFPGSPRCRHPHRSGIPCSNRRPGSYTMCLRGRQNGTRCARHIPPASSRPSRVRTPPQDTRPRTSHCPRCSRDTTSARRDTEAGQPVRPPRRHCCPCYRRFQSYPSTQRQLSTWRHLWKWHLRSTALLRLAWMRYRRRRHRSCRSRRAASPSPCRRQPRAGRPPQPKQAGAS